MLVSGTSVEFQHNREFRNKDWVWSETGTNAAKSHQQSGPQIAKPRPDLLSPHIAKQADAHDVLKFAILHTTFSKVSSAGRVTWSVLASIIGSRQITHAAPIFYANNALMNMCTCKPKLIPRITHRIGFSQPSLTSCEHQNSHASLIIIRNSGGTSLSASAGSFPATSTTKTYGDHFL